MTKASVVWAVLVTQAACGSPGGSAEVDAPTGDGGDGGGSIDAASGSFSFFITSLGTMRAQSGSQDGFGGNLGGLDGADAICQTAATAVGAGGKTWKAFLSAYNNGAPTHAIDRIGAGPWYDRNGKLIAIAGLISGNRPAGDASAINDLPDENGTPLRSLGDTHDILTGSNTMGRFDGASAAATCNDWTNAGPGTPDAVRLGHSWPAMSGQHWIRAHTARGCSPGVNLVQNGPGTGTSVGAGGGWGAIYCFAMTP
jgi:hypothetical protein